MKVSDIYKNTKLPVSFEIFPPKGEMNIRDLRGMLDGLAGTNPAFISVTCSAGGSGNSQNTAALTGVIEREYGIPAVAHITCINSTTADVDKYVADIIDSQITGSMSREEMLRKLYLYVRDHYAYLKRNLHEIGETGWEIDEALTMFQTGQGNCYNFTAAFWALARGVGYDAICVSGLVGKGRDPHSWMEVKIDGVQYIFDVETEMSIRLQGDYYTSCYQMTYEQGKYWSYAWEPYDD